MNTEILCPHCGAANPETARFCHRCGAGLPLPGRATESGAGVDEAPATREQGRDRDAQAQNAGVSQSESEESNSPNYWGQPVPVQDQPSLPKLPPAQFPTDETLEPGQSFLEPVTISGDVVDHLTPTLPGSGTAPLDVDRSRFLRVLMQSEPEFAPSPPAPVWRPPFFRSWWLMALLAVGVGLPLALSWHRPTGQPQTWPGVASAYEALLATSTNTPILVYWAYDPSTAGELDLAALPVVSQLLERGQQSLMVTTLPTGLATARRLYVRAGQGLPARAGVRRSQWLGEGVFLAGGAAALPFVGENLERTFASALTNPEILQRMDAPALAIVFAAQADDVQQWLELAQTRNRLPVIAVVGAGADPILRPYLDSGQLVGLVSGFDGAAAFQELRQTPLSPADEREFERQVVGQNWGQVTLLLIILVGNLAALVKRGRRA